jgi:AraC-like DNA-binding protein
MQPIPLVSGWNLQPFADFLRGIGAPVERWLVEARIPPDELVEPDRPVPLRHVLDFIEGAARAEGAESLGIDVGRQAAADGLGAFGVALARCVTLYDRVQTTGRLLSRWNNCQSIWLERDGANVRLHSRIDYPLEPHRRHGDDFTLMLMLEAVARAAAPGWKPQAIYLPGMRPQRFARDELFQGVQMIYGAPYVTIVFSSDLLASPLRPLSVTAGVSAHASAGSLPEREMPADLVRSLETSIASLLPIGCPSVHDLADIAGTTPRTLQRRVAACGTSLRQVVNRARFTTASDWLGDPNASVTDIALRLGYSDSTAFTRAFHRLAGMPPSTYRKQLLAS